MSMRMQDVIRKAAGVRLRGQESQPVYTDRRVVGADGVPVVVRTYGVVSGPARFPDATPGNPPLRRCRSLVPALEFTVPAHSLGMTEAQAREFLGRWK